MDYPVKRLSEEDNKLLKKILDRLRLDDITSREPRLKHDVEVKPEQIGPEVRMVRNYREPGTRTVHKVGERANIYKGHTFGCVRRGETPLIYKKRFPFIATPNAYFVKAD